MDDERAGRRRAGDRRAARLTRWARRHAIDLTPLRVSRDFRRLWLGLLASEVGYHFTVVASFVQVFELTRSNAATGLIGLFGFAAIGVGTIAGNAFIDARDRRATILGCQLAFAAAASVLLVGSLIGTPPIWVVYAAVGVIAGVSTIDASARQAITPRLVGGENLPSALALNQVAWNATALIGPAVAGILIARAGLASAYAFDVATYLLMFGVALTIAPQPPDASDADGARTGWRAVVDGVTFLRTRRAMQGAAMADVVAMIFGMPRALFPVLAVQQFDRGIDVVGLLFAAPALGALAGALSGGWVRRVRHQGQAVLWAVAVWGASIAAFGLVGRALWAALAFLALAGAADVISAIFRGTIIQLSVPDAMRGRVSSMYHFVVAGGPRLGDLEAGLVAEAFSPTVSVVSGGVLCIVGAGAVAALVPALRRYRSPETGADPSPPSVAGGSIGGGRDVDRA